MRWRTTVESTPYSPTPASSAAMAANAAISSSEKSRAGLRALHDGIHGLHVRQQQLRSNFAHRRPHRPAYLRRIALRAQRPRRHEPVPQNPSVRYICSRPGLRQRSQALVRHHADDFVPHRLAGVLNAAQESAAPPRCRWETPWPPAPGR